jgi:hypothetical protein
MDERLFSLRAIVILEVKLSGIRGVGSRADFSKYDDLVSGFVIRRFLVHRQHDLAGYRLPLFTVANRQRRN